MVQTLRAAGWSYATIAERLTADRVEAPRGGAWTPTGVKRVMERTLSAKGSADAQELRRWQDQPQPHPATVPPSLDGACI
ncbi:MULTISPECIES: recombinase family protein [unclassified Novosphingobium]|uniref:recombinase family protein n=1 Tax=unclassified Novosphingobium TaxID=2644732 RepID=UPI00096A0206|nr:recombinase family protein [Novosphingobium sp.]OJX94883.1 MAG: hypothetical protein BGP00_08185 [Novosphingobium sp. 63-713]